MLIGVFLSMFRQNENPFDFANYHYYNAFAFLNDRSGQDIVPACVNTFFNPIIDLPLYLYIQYFNDSPNIIYALQGIWTGLLLFTIYKMCFLFFPKNEKGMAFTTIVLDLAITAQSTFSQIGTSTNEITVAFFILWGFYILLKMIKFSETQTWQRFLCSGLIMGIGLGLKQTVITYCIASGLTLILCYPYFKKPIKNISVFALGGLVGYLIINGYFMYKYWILYGNPFFPFLNGIFHSPYFFDFNYRDAIYVPSWQTFFIYPFMWNIHPTSITYYPYYDIRLTVFYILPLILALVLSVKKQMKRFYFNERLFSATCIFCFLSLLIWMALFSMMRYAVVIEVIGAVIFVKLFDMYNARRHTVLFISHISVIVVMILSVIIYPSYGNVKKHIDLPKVSIPDNSLVKIYGLGISFVIPEISKGKNIKTITYYEKCTGQPTVCRLGEGTDFAEYGAFLAQRTEMEKNHQGPTIYFYDKDIKNFQSAELQKVITESDYFCTTFLKHFWASFIGNFQICVPKELKNEILGK